MGDASPQKRGWSLTSEALDRFLSRLDADREAAGAKYEIIRSKLISFFEWRGFHLAEDHADEAITRVIRKIDEGEEIRDPSTYVYGVARMLTLEISKQRERQAAAFDSLPSFEQRDDGESEMRVECLNRCLEKLPAENRLMIIEYYSQEKGEKIERRKRIAEKMGIPVGALRIRALRIRDKLGQCLDGCLSRKIER
jgi:RNA polymerase sigma factor (sigma-70 family)